jgi:hypothetical protein
VGGHGPSHDRSTAAAGFTAPAIDAGYRTIASESGDPTGVLADNGAVFSGRFRGGGRVMLEVTLHSRGVVLSHCRPYHRQTCGKVDSLHRRGVLPGRCPDGQVGLTVRGAGSTDARALEPIGPAL